MKPDNIINAIGMIDDEFIEAEAMRRKQHRVMGIGRKKTKKPIEPTGDGWTYTHDTENKGNYVSPWQSIISTAVAVCLIVAIAAVVLNVGGIQNFFRPAETSPTPGIPGDVLHREFVPYEKALGEVEYRIISSNSEASIQLEESPLTLLIENAAELRSFIEEYDILEGRLFESQTDCKLPDTLDFSRCAVVVVLDYDCYYDTLAPMICYGEKVNEIEKKGSVIFAYGRTGGKEVICGFSLFGYFIIIDRDFLNELEWGKGEDEILYTQREVFNSIEPIPEEARYDFTTERYCDITPQALKNNSDVRLYVESREWYDAVYTPDTMYKSFDSNTYLVQPGYAVRTLGIDGRDVQTSDDLSYVLYASNSAAEEPHCWLRIDYLDQSGRQHQSATYDGALWMEALGENRWNVFSASPGREEMEGDLLAVVTICKDGVWYEIIDPDGYQLLGKEPPPAPPAPNDPSEDDLSRLPDVSPGLVSAKKLNLPREGYFYQKYENGYLAVCLSKESPVSSQTLCFMDENNQVIWEHPLSANSDSLQLLGEDGIFLRTEEGFSYLNTKGAEQWKIGKIADYHDVVALSDHAGGVVLFGRDREFDYHNSVIHIDWHGQIVSREPYDKKEYFTALASWPGSDGGYWVYGTERDGDNFDKRSLSYCDADFSVIKIFEIPDKQYPTFDFQPGENRILLYGQAYTEDYNLEYGFLYELDFNTLGQKHYIEFEGRVPQGVTKLKDNRWLVSCYTRTPANTSSASLFSSDWKELPITLDTPYLAGNITALEDGGFAFAGARLSPGQGAYELYMSSQIPKMDFVYERYSADGSLVCRKTFPAQDSPNGYGYTAYIDESGELYLF